MGVSSTVVVAEARDAIEASIWVDALREAGVSASVYERGVGAALGGAATPGFSAYPVIVGRGELGRARSVIAEMAGAAVLSTFRDAESARAGQRRALITAAVVVVSVLVLGTLARVVAG
jgi:hypothetical protein